jgi:hypothetical protein
VSLSQIKPKKGLELKSTKDKNPKQIRPKLCHLVKKAYTPNSYAKNAYLKKMAQKSKEKLKGGNK